VETDEPSQCRTICSLSRTRTPKAKTRATSLQTPLPHWGSLVNAHKKQLIDNSELFDIDRELHDERSDAVPSNVVVESCEIFLEFLPAQEKDLVTPANCSVLAELAGEFGVPDLIWLCTELDRGRTNRLISF
jgi:hypothetical protein